MAIFVAWTVFVLSVLAPFEEPATGLSDLGSRSV